MCAKVLCRAVKIKTTFALIYRSALLVTQITLSIYNRYKMEMFKVNHVTDKADGVNFKGLMNKWPVQIQNKTKQQKTISQKTRSAWGNEYLTFNTYENAYV